MEKRIAKKTTSSRFGRKGDVKEFRGREKDAFPREIRKKFCRFCQDKVETIEYKDVTRLQKFVTERKRILSRRISGNCAKHQRKICHAIKRARFLALL